MLMQFKFLRLRRFGTIYYNRILISSLYAFRPRFRDHTSGDKKAPPPRAADVVAGDSGSAKNWVSLSLSIFLSMRKGINDRRRELAATVFGTMAC